MAMRKKYVAVLVTQYLVDTFYSKRSPITTATDERCRFAVDCYLDDFPVFNTDFTLEQLDSYVKAFMQAVKALKDKRVYLVLTDVERMAVMGLLMSELAQRHLEVEYAINDKGLVDAGEKAEDTVDLH